MARMGVRRPLPHCGCRANRDPLHRGWGESTNGVGGRLSKNNECGDNADFIRYFLIVWLIELKALWGKGLVDFKGAHVYAVCRWPAALFAENCRDKMGLPDYMLAILVIYLFRVCIIFA
ncbi:hypothetical protein [Burkholderia ambifaria]